MCLALFFTQSGTSADNLLKLGHRADILIKHDQLCHFAVSTRRQELRSRSDNRIRRADRDEVIELALAVLVRACDTHHIIRILSNHIRIEVDKSHPHTLRSILSRTEYDRFLHTVCADKVVRDFKGYLVDSVLNDDIVVIVGIVVYPVLNLVAIIVSLSFQRSPAVTNVCCDADDLKRSKKSVLNAVFEGVCVNRFAKIRNVRSICCLLRSSGHTDLCSRGEVFQYPAPLAVLFGTASVTLVHDDKIKEILVKQLGEMLLIIITDQLLIQREIDLM